MSALSKAEREIVLTIADDEQTWAVHTDSKRAASTRLLKVAKAFGVVPERTGEGWRFTLPLKAVRFGGPRAPRALSAETRERLQKADFGRRARSISVAAALLACWLVLGLAGPARAATLDARYWYGLGNTTALTLTTETRPIIRLQYVSGRYLDYGLEGHRVFHQTMRLQGDVGIRTRAGVLYLGYTHLTHRAEIDGQWFGLRGPVLGLRGTVPVSARTSVVYDVAVRPFNRYVHQQGFSAPAFGTEVLLGAEYRPVPGISLSAGWWQWWWDSGQTDAIWQGVYLGAGVRW